MIPGLSFRIQHGNYSFPIPHTLLAKTQPNIKADFLSLPEQLKVAEEKHTLVWSSSLI
jgi:hypothetical protein